MNSSTRISRSEVLDLCEAIHVSGPLPVFGARVLGLFLCVRLTLTYLRHNLSQELLTEVYCVWQATVSRVITAYTPLIAACLNGSVPTVEDLDPTAQLIIDGTLLECWSWKGHPELDLRQAQDHRSERPGRLHPSGTLAWVSPTPRTDARTTLRLCAAAACLTSRTDPHHRSTSATRGTSDWE